MKPDLGAASTTSVLSYTSRQPHAPNSSFTCANTADALLPFPARKKSPQTMLLHFPRALGAAPHQVQRVPRSAFPPFQDGFHQEGGASGTGERGELRPSASRPPRDGRSRPSARVVPHSRGVPSIPGLAPRGAPGRGRRPSRPPEAEVL